MNAWVRIAAAALVVASWAGGANAGEVEGKVVAVDAGAMKLTVKVNGRDVVYSCTPKTNYRDAYDGQLKAGLDSALFKKGAPVRVVTASAGSKDENNKKAATNTAVFVRVLR